MDRLELRKLLDARPFEPFTIHTTDGDLVGVKSPEFAWLPPTTHTVVVAIELGDGGANRIISLRHISQITVGPRSDASAA